MENDHRGTRNRIPRICRWGVVGIVVAFWDCGGNGGLPLAPSSANTPPVIVRVEVVGASQVAWGSTTPVSAEVRDSDGDAVSCGWSAQGGKVLVDSSNTCQGVYYAPATGSSERLDVVPRTPRGASEGQGPSPSHWCRTQPRTTPAPPQRLGPGLRLLRLPSPRRSRRRPRRQRQHRPPLPDRPRRHSRIGRQPWPSPPAVRAAIPAQVRPARYRSRLKPPIRMETRLPTPGRAVLPEGPPPSTAA